MADHFSVSKRAGGLTDNHEQRAFEAFEDKEGIQTISSGGELRTPFGMTPQLASFDLTTVPEGFTGRCT